MPGDHVAPPGLLDVPLQLNAQWAIVPKAVEAPVDLARLEQVPTPLSRVQEADGLWLANSLMGIMPVSSLEGKPVPVMVELTSFLKECLAQEARS